MARILAVSLALPAPAVPRVLHVFFRRGPK